MNQIYLSPENRKLIQNNELVIEETSFSNRRSSPDLLHHSESSPRHESLCSGLMSPRNFSTPIKLVGKTENVRDKSSTQSFSSYSFKSLPTHFTTPPSRIKEFVATNPFDTELINKLYMPMCSPTVFARHASPSKECQESFCWTIDDLSRIHPAPIEEQFIDINQVFSPETESRTQQVIESYFSATKEGLQSPWPAQIVKKIQLLPDSVSCTPASSRPTCQKPVGVELDCLKDVWTQTVLSLPPILPAAVEEALMPYFTFNQDQQQGGEMDESYLNASNTSQRRRKLFQQDAEVLSDARSGHLLIASEMVRLQGSPVISRSHGSPLHGSLHRQRSPSISPIAGHELVPLSKIRSASARLDFSDEGMAIDRSLSQRASSPTESPEGCDDKEDMGDGSWEETNDKMVTSQTEPYESKTSTPMKQDAAGLSFSMFSVTNHQDTGYISEHNATASSKTSIVSSEVQPNERASSVGLWETCLTHIVSSTPAKHTS